MHARFQNMRSDWKYTYWKDGHFLNAEILNSENWLKIHIHSKSTWSFGPLSSFGPVMVIRTPIRKDPRADSQSPQSIQRVQIQHGSIMRAVKTMYTLFCFRCIWFSVCDPNVICMVQLSSDLRKQYLYRTTAVLCAQCLDLSNLDDPRGTDSHIIGQLRAACHSPYTALRSIFEEFITGQGLL